MILGPRIRDFGSQICDLSSGIRDLGSRILGLGSRIRGLGSWITYMRYIQHIMHMLGGSQGTFTCPGGGKWECLGSVSREQIG